jgi:hypothetical protein
MGFMFSKLLIAYIVIGIIFMVYEVYVKPPYKTRGAWAYKVKHGKLQYSLIYIFAWPIAIILKFLGFIILKR